MIYLYAFERRRIRFSLGVNEALRYSHELHVVVNIRHVLYVDGPFKRLVECAGNNFFLVCHFIVIIVHVYISKTFYLE